MELKDKKTRITFHCGNKSIGGTLIEIRYESDRIIFDMGSKFDSEVIKKGVKFKDLIDNDLTCNIEGIFDKKIDGTKQSSECYNSAVFVSHCHLDHTNMINFVDPNIPVYASKTTKKMIEELNYNDDFLISKEIDSIGFTRDIIGLEFNEIKKVGKIGVELLAVDHDAYGSSGFIINTPDMRIAYTGDIRFHGYREDDSLNFCKAANGCDLLIMEGVTISFADLDKEYVNSSEIKVINEIEDILLNNKDKNISLNIYIANIERIKRLLDIKQRDLVLNYKTARMIKAVLGIDCLYYNLDSVNDELDKSFEVSFNDLLADKGRYLWQNEGRSLDFLCEIEDGSIYIHSDASPLGDFDPNYLPFVNKFSDNNIEMKFVLCSGHASPRDLFKIIELIKPKYLVPFHSFRPEKLYNKFGETILPEEKETI